MKRNKPAATPAETPARRFNTDDVSVQLQRAVAPLQIESLSLHNALGDLMWRNDGAFGDDEQAVVLDALDMFAIDERREDLRLKLDDDRSALFSIARDATQVMRGLAVVIVETPQSDELSAKLNGPRLQTQMHRFAQLVVTPAGTPMAAARGANTVGAVVSTGEVDSGQAPAMDDSAQTLLVPRRPMTAEEFTVRPDMTVSLSPEQTSDLLRGVQPAQAQEPSVEDMLAAASPQGFGSMEMIELSGDDSTQTALPRVDAVSPTAETLIAHSPTATAVSMGEMQLEAEQISLAPLASVPSLPSLSLPSLPSAPLLAAAPPRPVPVERRAKPAPDATADARNSSIRARRYTRLRAGGAARRYEVKPSPDGNFKGDLALTTMVAMHLQRSGDRYTQTPTTFTVPLSADSVAQSGWAAKVHSMMKRAELPRGTLGFSLSPAIWRDQAAATERFVAECDAIGCFIALDDFSLLHTGLGLLRSGAVKCLKLDPRLVAAVANDRFAHAQVVAILQAARVLGLYCVAKQVTSTSQVKWLTSAGVEFADGVGRGVVIAAAKREPSEV
ncbi:MAG TPA: EAL domain-containing protein [Steroidobacteraceae bacterium]|nr:EAL domain-containing protein [Steroidobacteraceae bacterium]